VRVFAVVPPVTENPVEFETKLRPLRLVAVATPKVGLVIVGLVSVLLVSVWLPARVTTEETARPELESSPWVPLACTRLPPVNPDWIVVREFVFVPSKNCRIPLAFQKSPLPGEDGTAPVGKLALAADVVDAA
jgi:hypothetical protein